MRRAVGIMLALVCWAVPASLRASSWDIDPAHTRAQFAVRHLMVSTVRGDFGKVSGVVTLDEQDIGKSAIEATIDMTSLDTRVAKRDEHLKSADFFDVAEYPNLTFKSTKVEQGEEGKFKVTGDLTMHGVTKEVVLDVAGSPTPIKDPFGNMRLGGQATTTIIRKDFGLAWNAPLETGGVVIGEEVEVIIDIELTQRKAEAGETAAK
jgi:polyisoprenoid-binding protein YceI